MIRNFSWIAKDQVAGMAYPAPDTWSALTKEGIGAVLTLTETAVQLPADAPSIEQAHVPIHDFGTPSMSTLQRCVSWIDEQLAAHRPVAVHCMAGQGRTGTVLAAWLVASGADPKDAIHLVRTTRPGSIETEGQAQAIFDYDEYLKRHATPESSDGIRVVFVGSEGRMGRALLPGLRSSPGLNVVATVDPATREGADSLDAVLGETQPNVVIDFTVPSAVEANIATLLKHGCHGVVGTTGLNADMLELIDAQARSDKLGILVAPNFSLGMILLQRFSREAAQYFPRAEIIERHHEGKLDAPSGTAFHTAAIMTEAGAQEPRDAGQSQGLARGMCTDAVQVHSVRLPGVHASQDVIFGGTYEGLTIKHQALDRRCYLPGVLMGVRGISSHVGLVHGLERLLFNERSS